MSKKLGYQIIWVFSLFFLLTGFKFSDPSSANLTLPLPAVDLISKMEQLCAQEEIKIGVRKDFEPFGYYGEDQTLIGFDVDLAIEFGRRWCGDETIITPVPLTADERFIWLKNVGPILIAGVSHTWDRDLDLDFSNPYFLSGQGLLVRKFSGIKSITQLYGKPVVVLNKTTAETITCQRPELNLKCQAKQSEEVNLALDLLAQGQVEAFIRDSLFLSKLEYDPETFELVMDDTGQPYVFTHEPYAIGVQQGETELRELINATLQAMKEDGMYDALSIKWFGDRQPYPILQISGLDALNLNLTREYSKIELIRARGKWLVVGVKTDTPGFGSPNKDKEGKLEGFDIDLVKAIAQEWGIDENRIIFVPVTSANRIEKLLNNEIDFIAATMTHTWDRANLIAFSNSYFLDGPSIMVVSGSDITNVADLSGRTVAAIRGSTGETELRQRGIEPRLYDSNDEAIAHLEAGDVDAFINDSIILSGFEKRSGGRLTTVGGLLSQGPYGLGLPKDDYHFIDLVNCALQELKANGTYDTIYNNWFSDGSTPAAVYNMEIFPGERACDFDAVQATLEQPASSLKLDDRGNILVDEEGNITFANSVKLRVGIRDLPPFASKNQNNQWVGLDVDIVYDFARRWFQIEDENRLAEAVEFKEVSSEEEAVRLLQEGQIDLFIAAVTHRTVLDQNIDFSQTYFAKKNPTGEGFSQGPYGIGIRQFDSHFENLVNFTLQAMKCDGTYDTLYRHYLPDEGQPYNLELWPVVAGRDVYERINTKKMDERHVNLCIGTGERTYTVAPGDTVSKIVEIQYGDLDRLIEVCEYNRDVIGNDCNKIEVGMVLRLP